MFSFFYARVQQINPLLPFFNIFSGTHVRPCVQVATPLKCLCLQLAKMEMDYNWKFLG